MPIPYGIDGPAVMLDRPSGVDVPPIGSDGDWMAGLDVPGILTITADAGRVPAEPLRKARPVVVKVAVPVK